MVTVPWMCSAGDAALSREETEDLLDSMSFPQLVEGMSLVYRLPPAEMEWYLVEQTTDQVIGMVQMLYAMSHLQPEVREPQKLIVLEKRDLHIDYQSPLIITIGPFRYQVSLHDEEYTDFVPRKSKKPLLLFGAGGIVLGLIVGAAIGG